MSRLGVVDMGFLLLEERPDCEAGVESEVAQDGVGGSIDEAAIVAEFAQKESNVAADVVTGRGSGEIGFDSHAGEGGLPELLLCLLLEG